MMLVTFTVLSGSEKFNGGIMKNFLFALILLFVSGCDRLFQWEDILDESDHPGKLGAGGEPSPPPPPPSPSTTPDGRPGAPA